MQPVGKDSSLHSWPDGLWKFGDTGTTGGITYDPNLNLVYYGSGSHFLGKPSLRKGDNRWGSSLWARDADTGIVKWVYQMTPHNEWFFSGENESILLDQKINDTLRQTLVHFDHNGFVYTLDRVTGELLSAEKYDANTNWADHIDIKTGRPQIEEKYSYELSEDKDIKGVCPSYKGGKGLQPASFSRRSQLFYISGDNHCGNISGFDLSILDKAGEFKNISAKQIKGEFKGGEYIEGQAFYRMYQEGVIPKNAQHNYLDFQSEGYFSAWNPNEGKIQWKIIERFPIVSGSIATAGDVVFYGTLEGDLKAVNANTGVELYKFRTPSGIVGNISTWQYNGKQFIGLLSSSGWEHYINPLGLNCKYYNGLGISTQYSNYHLMRKKICRQHEKGTFMVFTLPDNFEKTETH